MALILSKAPHKVADEVLDQYDEPNEDDQEQNCDDNHHVLRKQVFIVGNLKQLMIGSKVQIILLQVKGGAVLNPLHEVFIVPSQPVEVLCQEVVHVAGHESLQEHHMRNDLKRVDKHPGW